MSPLRMPKTAAEALAQVADIVEGRCDAYHNLVMDASEYGPERYVALAASEASQIQAACEIAKLLLLQESLT